MKETILITGGNGFIGNNLYKKLKAEKKHKIILLDRKKVPFTDTKKLEKILSNITVVVHLGGLRMGSLDELYKANVESTRNILLSISNLKVAPLFIYASSFAVYGIQDRKISEDTILKPRNDYGKSKLEAEKIIKKLVERNKMKAIILRFSTVYGRGSHSIISGICKSIKNNEVFNINGDGTQLADLVHVDDAVDSIIKSFSCPISDGEIEILNICEGGGISINDIISFIENVSEKELVKNYKSEILTTGYWIGNNSKAKKVIGWSPKKKLEDEIKNIYEAE